MGSRLRFGYRSLFQHGGWVGRARPIRWRDPHTLAALSINLAAVLWSCHESRLPIAQSYIDPGSGALLVQLVASFFLGLLFYLRGVRRFFSRLLARTTGRGIEHENEPEA